MSWKIDPSHSEITFSVRHMMITNVRGRFEEFDGSVEFDEQNPEHTTVEVQIAANSINTRDPKRDAHLKSPDFFNAERSPYLTFKSQKVEPIDKTHGRLVGDLTIRDLTRPVTLEVVYNGQSKAPWGATSAGFSANTTLNRKDWGLTWNVGLETGGWLVGDEININVELELIKQPEAELAPA
jgi:polyisoprenoid-binding protein YceI